MNVFVTTPELAPYGGPSTTAQVCAALPKGLLSLGHRVTVVSPLYKAIDPTTHNLARKLSKLDIEVAGEAIALEIYEGRTSAGVDLVFLGHETLFREADGITTGDDDALIAKRGAAFAHGVAALLSLRQGDADLVHAHGWVGALIVSLVKDVPTVLSIHEVGSPTTFDAATASVLGVEAEGAQVDVVPTGLKSAKRIIVNSPSEARTLSAQHESLAVTGIQPGVDFSIWNPLTDPHAASRFDPVDIRGKARCKAALQSEAGLPINPEVPLITVMGTDDAAWAAFEEAAPTLVESDLQIAVFTLDEERIERLAMLRDRYEDRVGLLSVDKPHQVHRVFSAGDLTLVLEGDAKGQVPQMIAHRYGALPVGISTDGVVDCDGKLESGNAFIFGEFSAENILSAVRRAVAAFDYEDEFSSLSRRAMRNDHSWERSARLYDRIYRAASA